MGINFVKEVLKFSKTRVALFCILKSQIWSRQVAITACMIFTRIYRNKSKFGQVKVILIQIKSCMFTLLIN
jgi:hypothetical protein